MNLKVHNYSIFSTWRHKIIVPVLDFRSLEWSTESFTEDYHYKNTLTASRDLLKLFQCLITFSKSTKNRILKRIHVSHFISNHVIWDTIIIFATKPASVTNKPCHPDEGHLQEVLKTMMMHCWDPQTYTKEEKKWTSQVFILAKGTQQDSNPMQQWL